MNTGFLLSCSEDGLDLSRQDEPQAPSILRAQQSGAVLEQMLQQFVVPARMQAVTSSKQIDALAWSPLQQVLHRHLQRRLSAESRMNVKISGELRHESSRSAAKLTRGGGDHIEFGIGLLRKNNA